MNGTRPIVLTGDMTNIHGDVARDGEYATAKRCIEKQIEQLESTLERTAFARQRQRRIHSGKSRRILSRRSAYSAETFEGLTYE